MDKNCLSWWYPQIEGKVPTPQTKIVKIEHCQDIILAAGEGYTKHPAYNDVAEKIKAACLEISEAGPWFLRTGQTSNKHSWVESCFVEDLATLPDRVCHLTEFSGIVDLMGLDVSVWVVREYLPVTPMFRTYNGMPFVPEWRAFVGGEGVEKIIKYWPKDALRQGNPNDTGWEKMYDLVYRSPCPYLVELQALAQETFNCLDDQSEPMSIDLLWVEKEQKFYVTDMALARRSWGYSDEVFEIE